jgi:hypothetical protein
MMMRFFVPSPVALSLLAAVLAAGGLPGCGLNTGGSVHPEDGDEIDTDIVETDVHVENIDGENLADDREDPTSEDLPAEDAAEAEEDPAVDVIDLDAVDIDAIEIEVVDPDLAVWVDDHGNDSGTGTLDDPLLTIDLAIRTAAASSRSYVHVMRGGYDQQIHLESGITVIGGFDDHGTHSGDASLTVIRTEAGVDVIAEGVDETGLLAWYLDGTEVARARGAEASTTYLLYALPHVARNNLDYGSGGNYVEDLVDDLVNSWNDPPGIVLDATDFLSLEPAELETLFMRLAPGSEAIDAGVDVGMSFNGEAPDLGAFESI